jgi:hypothetical protein
VDHEGELKQNPPLSNRRTDIPRQRKLLRRRLRCVDRFDDGAQLSQCRRILIADRRLVLTTEIGALQRAAHRAGDGDGVAAVRHVANQAVYLRLPFKVST